MQYDEKDLEAILRVALAKAPAEGIDVIKFEGVYRAAVQEVSEKKANDAVELYRTLQPSVWFVESFQMRTKSFGVCPSLPHIKKGETTGAIPYRVHYNNLFTLVNTVFKVELSDHKRGEGMVYVWLERTDEDKGILQSYGNAHMDGVARNNMHYFAVVADYAVLSRVVDSFRANPTNLSTFAREVFGWRNEQPRHMGGEPNMFSRMGALRVYTPELGHK